MGLGYGPWVVNGGCLAVRGVRVVLQLRQEGRMGGGEEVRR